MSKRLLTSPVVCTFLVSALFGMLNCAIADTDRPLTVLNLPDPKIAEVYRGNWENTLKPCICPPSDVMEPKDRDTEPQRPWKVDVDGHYPGWYPGVDMKHSAAAYLACQKDLDLVLRAWKVTTERYQMPDGAIRAMTMNGNPNSVVPETTVAGNVVYYPLRLTGCIDYILLGDMIFRFSQDKEWLADNIEHMRLTAKYIEGWIDDEGLLHSDSYDLDQVYREIDGVAQAAATDALQKLSQLEKVLRADLELRRKRTRDERKRNRRTIILPDCGNLSDGTEFERYAVTIANALAKGQARFWDTTRDYFLEQLTYNNIACVAQGGRVMAVSSSLDSDHGADKAIDGIVGCGIDAFGVGRGAAGKHEWAADNERNPWIQIALKQPARINEIILVARTEPGRKPQDCIASGVLEFSDRSEPVEVRFNQQNVSRAMVSFRPREVSWVKFTVAKVRSTLVGIPNGTGSPGLAEFIVLPADEPYKKFTHGMTDTNFAMLGFNVADDDHAAKVWEYFKAHEPAFYTVNGLSAPTWIAEDTPSYSDQELNRRAPRKDCVAMGRTWRYDALMRYRMHDGDGLYKTITYANALYDRPSGGGPGFFAERYGLGRFQPGDESQANVLKYAEYPAVYNSTVVQQCLLGLDVGYDGSITIAPCVPADWYDKGFGMENPGLLKDRDLGFTYHADSVEGWVSGKVGTQVLSVQPPPGIKPSIVRVLVDGSAVVTRTQGGWVIFSVEINADRPAKFLIEHAK